MRSGLAFVGTMILTILVMVIRGLLLWVSIPITLVAWLLSLPVLALRRLMGKRSGSLHPMSWIRYSTQILDAALVRVFFRSFRDGVDWPWKPSQQRASANPFWDLV